MKKPMIAVIEGSTKYSVDYIDDGRIFETKERIRADDIYRTATGRAILVNLSKEDVLDIYHKYGTPAAIEWPEIKSFNSLLKYIAAIQKDTIFKTRFHPEFSDTVNIGYGSAVFSNIGCVGAVGIAANIPLAQEADFLKEEDKIKKILYRATKEINYRLSQ